MFSFMNIAQAAQAELYYCGNVGTYVDACSNIKEATQCAKSYRQNKATGPTYGVICKWIGSYCIDGGGACTTKQCTQTEISSQNCPYVPGP